MQCVKCGALISSVGALTHCHICGDFLHPSDPMKNQLTKTAGIPWENMEHLGIIRALYLTIYSCLLKPSTFFNYISEKSSLFHALLFGLCTGSIGILFDFFWNYRATNYLHTLTHFEFNSASNINASLLIFSPLIIIITIFAMSLYIHLLLLITNGKHRNFKSTTIALCYSQSIAVLNIVPLIGKIVATFWGLYIIITGISLVHAISKTRSSLTILLPLFLLLSFLIFSIALIIGGSVLSSTLFKEIIPLIR